MRLSHVVLTQAVCLSVPFSLMNSLIRIWSSKLRQADKPVSDHVIVLNERHLRRILTSCVNYYHHWRTHLSLGMDSPDSRAVQPPDLGKVVEFPEVGGLHRHYERLAA